MFRWDLNRELRVGLGNRNQKVRDPVPETIGNRTKVEMESQG